MRITYREIRQGEYLGAATQGPQKEKWVVDFIWMLHALHWDECHPLPPSNPGLVCVCVCVCVHRKRWGSMLDLSN